MKRFKYFLAIVLAFAMTFANVTPVFAAAQKPADAKVTVTGLDQGDSVKFYQVLEWDTEATHGGWKAAAGFTTLTATEITTITGSVRHLDSNGNWVDAVPGEIDYALASKISGMTTDATAKATVAVGADGKAEYATTAEGSAGLYIAIVSASQPDIIYNPVFVAADYTAGNSNEFGVEVSPDAQGNAHLSYSDESVAKKTKESVFKTIDEAEQAIQTAIDSKVGDEVNFTINTTVPVFAASYTHPTFVVTDTVSAGLEVKTGTTTITGVDASAYSISETASKITITFNEEFLKANAAAKDITIKYTATVTSDADFNINYDENDVNVTFSRTPGGDLGVVKDITNHYTFSLGANVLGDSSKKTSEIVKVGVDKDGNYVTELHELDNQQKVGSLAGAKFGLYTDSDCTQLFTNTIYPNGAEFTTQADGIITFKGLDAGTYYLKEIEAPATYIADTQVHTVIITPTYENVDVTEWVNPSDFDDVKTVETEGYLKVTYSVQTLTGVSVTIDGQDARYTITNQGPHTVSTSINEASFQVNNTLGTELPATGGIGTTIFYVVGGAMVLCGVVMLITKRRLAQIEE